MSVFVFPSRIPLTLTWANRTVQLTVHWFQRESDPERNSNAYEVAQKLVNEQFPGGYCTLCTLVCEVNLKSVDYYPSIVPYIATFLVSCYTVFSQAT